MCGARLAKRPRSLERETRIKTQGILRAKALLGKSTAFTNVVFEQMQAWFAGSRGSNGITAENKKQLQLSPQWWQ
jgi:hypothetical protein